MRRRDRRTFVVVAVTSVLVITVIMLVVRFHSRIEALVPAPVVEGVTQNSSSIHDDGTRVIAVPKHPNGKLVIFMHGSDQSARAILVEPRTTTLTAPLLAAGYVVAASAAGGNAWGNAASVKDYEQLIAYATSKYHTSRTFVVAESMGGLSAAQVVSAGGVNAWVAIYPVCNVASLTAPNLVSQIKEIYPHGAPSRLSPLKWPNVPVAVWASPHDTYVPARLNGYACARSVDASPTVSKGNHNDPSNYDPRAVLAFFARN